MTGRPVCAAFVLVALVCTAAPAVARSVPEVATTTFAAPREWKVRPKAIALGDSQCSPYFDKLRWSSWGRRRATGRGYGVLPKLRGGDDSCGAAFERAHIKAVRVTLSRPRTCDGHRSFSRIAWRYGGHRGHYQSTR